MQKISQCHQFFLEIVNFRVQRPDWPHSFLTMPHQKIFNQIFVNLHQPDKNEAVSSICYGEMLALKILQSEWLRPFQHISQEQHFPQIDDLYRNTALNINFHYRKNSGKINGQFFLQIQKNPIFGHFLTHFPNFGVQKKFSQKIWLAQLHKVFQYYAEIQRNLMIQFQQNNPTDSRMEEGTDPISQDPSGYCQGSNKYSCSRSAFKVKDIEYDICLTKNSCLTVSM